jgi:hypothetical protein
MKLVMFKTHIMLDICECLTACGSAVVYRQGDKWVPVTTAWCVLRLWMEEQPPDMEGSREYIE